MAADNWAGAKAAAIKILGDKAKIPDPKTNFTKLSEVLQKADKEYDASVDVLQGKILALQNINSTYKNSFKQYQDLISKSNFGLNPKDSDDKDKIDQAAKVLDDFLDAQMENCDVNIKNLDELDKHSMAISKYESQTGTSMR